MSRTWRALQALCATLLLSWTAVEATEPNNSTPRAFTMRFSLKGAALISQAPNAPMLYPERNAATSFWRLRFEPELRLFPAGPDVAIVAAYEQRLRVSSASTELSAGILPSEAPAPYRLSPLDWQLARSQGSSWRHEIDRFSAVARLSRVTVTLGRQAIGWGRGVLFGAVDLFSPFAPFEADREWRRGVDAVRADIKLKDRVSLDLVGAFGESSRASTFAARLRGYAGKADLEIVAGRRARDLFAGVTSSAAVGDAELHAEVAAFRTPDGIPSVDDVERTQVAWKAVAGASYRFGLGNGLMVFGEYHYSGFGVKDAGQILPLAKDPEFRDRYARGDTQILGRHAVAILATYEASPELTLSATWLHNPQDGSGLAAPSATLTMGDRLSILLTAYVPYGARPTGMALRSEHGGTPRALFLQLRVYGAAW